MLQAGSLKAADQILVDNVVVVNLILRDQVNDQRHHGNDDQDRQEHQASHRHTVLAEPSPRLLPKGALLLIGNNSFFFQVSHRPFL